MRSAPSFLLAFLLALALTTACLAGASSTTEPIHIGDAVPAFELTDLSGATFSLASARDLTEEKALEVVLDAVKSSAGGAALTGDTELSSLAGLGGDAAAIRGLLLELGHPHGLIPALDAHEDLDTLADVATWLADSASAPIVFMCWSPMCPTSRGYEERIQEILSAYDARLYPLASTSAQKESDTDTLKYLTDRDLPYRVLLDREQKACDIFGGQVTPHIFVVDAENKLAYAGSIDDDARCATASSEDRQNWLADALEALADERPVGVLRTTPKG